MAAHTELSGRYRLRDRPFGHGGMGQVWLAEDVRLERTVVVKLIHTPHGPPDDILVQRFLREAKLTAQLRHPGVPVVYDFGVHDDHRPFIVMQRIDGVDVDCLIEDHHPLPIGWVATIGAQVSSVLMAAHRAGLIHRDVKPANLMLERSGTVKVLDFGVAGVFGRDDVTRITRTGEAVGTAEYMAPEQFENEAVTGQADLYSLGCTLYELLTGAPPFTAPTSFTLMRMHLERRPERPQARRADVPPALQELVLDLLQKHPADRPASAAEVYDRLLPFADELPDLPGVLAPGSDPARAYIALSSRLPATTEKATAEASAAGTAPIDRVGLGAVQHQARELAGASRLDEAVRVLSRVVEPAVRAFGPLDSDVLDVRAMRSALLEELGEHRAAARAYRSLAADLSLRFGPDDERVLAYRREAARAHVALGETARARSQFAGLADDYARVFGAEHKLVQDLRAEIEALGS